MNHHHEKTTGTCMSSDMIDVFSPRNASCATRFLEYLRLLEKVTNRTGRLARASRIMNLLQQRGITTTGFFRHLTQQPNAGQYPDIYTSLTAELEI